MQAQDLISEEQGQVCYVRQMPDGNNIGGPHNPTQIW